MWHLERVKFSSISFLFLWISKMGNSLGMNMEKKRKEETHHRISTMHDCFIQIVIMNKP